MLKYMNHVLLESIRTSLPYITWITYVFAIVGMIGNTMICYIIVRNKDMLTPVNFYLFSIASSDFLNCISWILFYVYPITGLPFHPILIPIEIVIGSVCMFLNPIINMLTTTALSFERYIAICHPLKAAYMSSKSRTVKIILSIWLFAIVYSTIYSLVIIKYSTLISDSDIFRKAILLPVCFLYIIPSATIVVLYFLIATSIWTSGGLTESCGIQNISGSRQLAAQRCLGISGTVVLELFICKLPWIVCINIYIFMPSIYIFELEYLSKYLNIASCLVDPILYSIVCSRFRKAFQELFYASDKHKLQPSRGSRSQNE